ncbi:ankyrin [Daldinia grandis]|nr:ankyrin [Daldinia grandis]
MSVLRGTDTGKQAVLIARNLMGSKGLDSRKQAILQKVITPNDENADASWPVHEPSLEDVNLCDDTGYAPPHMAVLRRDDTAIRILISHGANLNCVSKFNQTSLMLAATPSKYDQARLLIDSGCDINAVSGHDRSALCRATQSTKRGSAEIVSLLLYHGARTSNHAENTLHWLEECNETADMEDRFNLFVRAGVKIEEKDKYGYIVLVVAFEDRNGHMLRLLARAGCRFDESPINDNALMKVAWRGYSESIDVLERTKFTADAFWELLQGVRNCYLTAEIQSLGEVITHIKNKETTLARETLQPGIQEKIDWKIPAEYRTFREIDVQIKGEMMEAAIGSLEEFIEVSEERIGSHHRGNRYKA